MSSLSSRKVALRRGPEQEVIRGGEGPPLVWLHGLKPPRADDPLLQALAADHAVHAPVMPGQGALSELDDFPTLHDLVLFYDGALDALGLEHALLVGHSFGGMLAAEIAALAPRRTRGLVLISPMGLWNDAYPVEDLFARPYAEMETLVWSGAAQRPSPPDPAEGGLEAHLAMINAIGSVAKYMWPIPDRGLRGRLYRICAPTLLVFAEGDALLPAAYGQDFREGLTEASLRRVEGSHMWPYEDPDMTARMISEFAATLP
jgi:pimeloyl-ACP methyl ester carboxylesterase